MRRVGQVLGGLWCLGSLLVLGLALWTGQERFIQLAVKACASAALGAWVVWTLRRRDHTAPDDRA